MNNRGSLKKLTFVMMGMCIFYGATAFKFPVTAKTVDPNLTLALSIMAGIGLVGGIINALLTSPMLPANMAKTRLIISLALMESAAVMGFVLRTMGAQPTSVLPFFIAPVIAIGLLILPRALASQE
ncbi:MAG: hypothetical protein RLZZ78_1434 [Armatimonadota bacterium]|jgi:hypothetical protein